MRVGLIISLFKLGYWHAVTDHGVGNESRRTVMSKNEKNKNEKVGRLG